MKHLVKHLLENNLKEILEKSYKNCHCYGIHSIMLLEAPEKTIRVFITDPDHHMWHNYPSVFKNGQNMSIAFHPHHCNISMYCTAGEVFNWCIEETEESGVELNKYLYKDHINKGEMKFDFVKNQTVWHTHSKTLYPGDFLMLLANEIHTVACPIDKISAWVIMQGKEDKDYIPYCYSNHDLTKVNDENLYKKFSDISEIKFLLTKANLL